MTEQENAMTGRAAIYEYLSMVFITPPSAKFIGLSQKFLPYFKNMAELSSDAAFLEGVALLEKYVMFENSHDELTVTERLNIEYTSLFLIGSSGVALTESVNLTPERLNKQEPWESVMMSYFTRSFKVPDDFREPEDHIAMEFLFMMEMCALTAALLRIGGIDKARRAVIEQKLFLDEHLLRWVPTVCAELYRKALGNGSLLYQAIARLTAGFLYFERDFLETIPVE